MAKLLNQNTAATMPCTQLQHLLCLWSNMQMAAPHSTLTYQKVVVVGSCEKASLYAQ